MSNDNDVICKNLGVVNNTELTEFREDNIYEILQDTIEQDNTLMFILSVSYIKNYMKGGCPDKVGMAFLYSEFNKQKCQYLNIALDNINVNVNVKSAYTGDTLFHDAAYFHHVELLRLLINLNGNANVKDDLGNSPLHKICQSAKYYMTYIEDDEQRIMDTDTYDNFKTIIKLLLCAGCNNNEKNNHGHTAEEILGMNENCIHITQLAKLIRDFEQDLLAA